MQESLVTISEKGQVTVPAEVRKFLGVSPKDKLTFVMEEGEVKVRAAKASLDDIYQSVPALSRHLTVEDMIAIAREEHAQHVAQEGLER